MASRSGPRALGTDGSDYKHRETVASHYSKSVDLKVSVRKCLMPHMLLAALYIGKYIAVMLGSKYFVPLASWEIVWLVSGICAFIGYSSLSRNDIPRLLVYIVGNIVFGLVPLVFGVNQLINQVKKDFSNMKHARKLEKLSYENGNCSCLCDLADCWNSARCQVSQYVEINGKS